MIEINAVDVIAGTTVLISLLKVTKNPKFWLLYAVGCLIYCVLNYSAGLFAQSIMNVVVAGVSVKNFLTSRKLDSDTNCTPKNTKIGCNGAWWD
jgi:hypothetical protein